MITESLTRGDRLMGRRILVTGAASGIGLAVSTLFVQQGASVAMTDMQADLLESAAATVGGVSLAADLTDRDAASGLIDAARDVLGGLDGLVNCAGVVHDDPVDELSLDWWDLMISVNLTAPFLTCRAAAPLFRRQAGSTIVNIASGMGLLPTAPGGSGYAASKGGLVMFSKALAAELAPLTRVNVVAPGLVRTPMTLRLGVLPRDPVDEPTSALLEPYALKRSGDPSEIAATVLFLTSAESSYITGATLAVDGGRTFH